MPHLPVIDASAVKASHTAGAAAADDDVALAGKAIGIAKGKVLRR